MNVTPEPATPTKRTLPWALITFAALVLCSLATLLIMLTGGNLDEFKSGRPSWTPVAPAGEIVQASSPDGQSFASGDSVSIAYSGGVNLRRTPGYQNKPAGDTLRTVNGGATGTITGGPVELDGLRWWQVRFDADEGWMAERSSQGRLLLESQAP